MRLFMSAKAVISASLVCPGLPGLGKVFDVNCVVTQVNQVRDEDARQLRVHDEIHCCDTEIRPRTG